MSVFVPDGERLSVLMNVRVHEASTKKHGGSLWLNDRKQQPNLRVLSTVLQLDDGLCELDLLFFGRDGKGLVEDVLVELRVRVAGVGGNRRESNAFL